jgi:sugar phosphate isomerase/epimerase
MAKLPIGVQLYTVREEMQHDLPGTLEKIAAIGLSGIELWFKGDYPPVTELRKYLSDAGLSACSAHVPFLALRDDFDAVVEYHGELGNPNLAIPNIPPPLRKSEEDWRARVGEILEIAKKVKQAGFKFHYHNHTVEFTDKVDDVDVHDFIFNTIPAELLNAELDTCFIKKAGKDPFEYICRYADRMQLLHVKEAHQDTDKVDTYLGNGTVDWPAVFAAVEESQVEWLILEQGDHESDAFDSMRKSWSFLASYEIVE